MTFVPHGRRVVVTGVGILSGLGKDAKAAWNGVLNGLSAVRALGPDDKVAKLDVLPSRVSNALSRTHMHLALGPIQSTQASSCTWYSYIFV